MDYMPSLEALFSRTLLDSGKRIFASIGSRQTHFEIRDHHELASEQICFLAWHYHDLGDHSVHC